MFSIVRCLAIVNNGSDYASRDGITLGQDRRSSARIGAPPPVRGNGRETETEWESDENVDMNMGERWPG